jgi:hypothetical protein
MLQLYVGARKKCILTCYLMKFYVQFGLNSIVCWFLLFDELKVAQIAAMLPDSMMNIYMQETICHATH